MDRLGKTEDQGCPSPRHHIPPASNFKVHQNHLEGVFPGCSLRLRLGTSTARGTDSTLGLGN